MNFKTDPLGVILKYGKAIGLYSIILLLAVVIIIGTEGGDVSASRLFLTLILFTLLTFFIFLANIEF